MENKPHVKLTMDSKFFKFGGFFCFFFAFLGPHPQHVEVPRLGVELELQLPVYTTATATPDPNCVCDLHHSSRQRQIRTSSVAYTIATATPDQNCVCGLHHSHSDSGSEQHLRPTPQLTAMPDPEPTEHGQGSNLQPHGS